MRIRPTCNAQKACAHVSKSGKSVNFSICFGRSMLTEMEDKKKLYLFEEAPIGKAAMSMAIPTVISSLVMVIYNLADTYFVGMLNNPVENAAVSLAAPVLLAFNAVNNLFGVGSSSLMSRALGSKEYDKVRRVSAFGFYCTVFCGIMFSLLCTIAQNPVLALLGTDGDTFAATVLEMDSLLRGCPGYT